MDSLRWEQHAKSTGPKSAVAGDRDRKSSKVKRARGHGARVSSSRRPDADPDSDRPTMTSSRTPSLPTGAIAREATARLALARSGAGSRRAAARRVGATVLDVGSRARGTTALRVAAPVEGTQVDGAFFEPEDASVSRRPPTPFYTPRLLLLLRIVRSFLFPASRCDATSPPSLPTGVC